MVKAINYPVEIIGNMTLNISRVHISQQVPPSLAFYNLLFTNRSNNYAVELPLMSHV